MNTCHLISNWLKHLTVASLFDIDTLEIAHCSKHCLLPLGNLGQALIIRSCHEDVIFTRKSHDCAGTEFVQRRLCWWLKVD